MAFNNTPANTGDNLATMDPAAMRKLWDAKIRIHDQNNDFFARFEAKRADAMIERKDDTSKGGGQSITFTSQAGFYGKGKHGDETFATAADFEKVKLASKPLYVDWLRNGTSWTKRMEDHMGLRNEITSAFPENMGAWVGRKKTQAMWMMFRERGTAENYIVVDGKAIDELGSADTLGWLSIKDAGVALKTMGASPAYLGKVGKNHIRRYNVIGVETALGNLKDDEMYLEVLEQAGADGSSNELFSGGWADVDGHCIQEFLAIDHDGNGPVGSPINPKLILKDAVAAGTTAFDMTGGDGDTNVEYTESFPLHDFVFNASDTLDASADSALFSGPTFYVLVVNPINAETDPGKFGFYECDTNDGNKITVSKRLGSATAGIRNTTVGSVTWDTGIWSGKHTDVHPAGAVAYLANAKGQPIGMTLVAGASAARRGYGAYRNTRMTDDAEAGFVQETYVWTVFGQAPVMRADKKFPNFKMLVHAVNYPQVNLPNIV